MAITRSPKGSYWDLGDGRYFVPNVDHMGGYRLDESGTNVDRYIRNADGMNMVGPDGQLLVDTSVPNIPQTAWTAADGDGVWRAYGAGGTSGTLDDILPGFGALQGQAGNRGGAGTFYTQAPSEQWFQNSPDKTLFGVIDASSLPYIASVAGPWLGLGGLNTITGGAFGATPSFGSGATGAFDAGGWGNIDVMSPSLGVNPQNGAGMFDFLDVDNWDLFGAGNSSVDPFGSAYDAVAANDPVGALINNLNSGMNPQQAVAAVEQAIPGSTQSLLQFYANNPSQVMRDAGGIRNLLSGGGSDIGNLFRSILGGNATQGGGGFLNTAVSTLPIIGAIEYARNQQPFDTSRLNSLFQDYNPRALAADYDLNTGLGREALNSSLERRGVLGSSFGDQSLTSFNTARDLGRANLLTQGAGGAANIANAITNAEVESRKQKNQLYGLALNALGSVFGGRSGGLNINLGG